MQQSYGMKWLAWNSAFLKAPQSKRKTQAFLCLTDQNSHQCSHPRPSPFGMLRIRAAGNQTNHTVHDVFSLLGVIHKNKIFYLSIASFHTQSTRTPCILACSNPVCPLRVIHCYATRVNISPRRQVCNVACFVRQGALCRAATRHGTTSALSQAAIHLLCQFSMV